MTAISTFQLPKTPLQRKAREIFVLSRKISQYLLPDLAVLNKEGREHPSIYFTGDIVQQSSFLFPEIIQAEQKVFSEDKYKHVASLEQLILLLHKNCDRIEHSVSHGKEFIQLLRRELIKFRKLKRKWLLTL